METYYLINKGNRSNYDNFVFSLGMFKAAYSLLSQKEINIRALLLVGSICKR